MTGIPSPEDGPQGLTAREYAQVSGRPLPEILMEMRLGNLPYQWVNGERKIPYSYLYPTLYK